jgi:hypothetical protein
MLARSFTTRLTSHPRAGPRYRIQKLTVYKQDGRLPTASPSLRLHRAQTFGGSRVA